MIENIDEFNASVAAELSRILAKNGEQRALFEHEVSIEVGHLLQIEQGVDRFNMIFTDKVLDEITHLLQREQDDNGVEVEDFRVRVEQEIARIHNRKEQLNRGAFTAFAESVNQDSNPMPIKRSEKTHRNVSSFSSAERDLFNHIHRSDRKVQYHPNIYGDIYGDIYVDSKRKSNNNSKKTDSSGVSSQSTKDEQPGVIRIVFRISVKTAQLIISLLHTLLRPLFYILSRLGISTKEK